jgi:sulfur-carrier protein
MTARVVLPAGFSRRYTDGLREFSVAARNLRGVIKALDQLYPGLGVHLEQETTVAIDGEIHEIGYLQPLRQDSEVFFIPKIEGG